VPRECRGARCAQWSNGRPVVTKLSGPTDMLDGRQRVVEGFQTTPTHLFQSCVESPNTFSLFAKSVFCVIGLANCHNGEEWEKPLSAHSAQCIEYNGICNGIFAKYVAGEHRDGAAWRGPGAFVNERRTRKPINKSRNGNAIYYPVGLSSQKNPLPPMPTMLPDATSGSNPSLRAIKSKVCEDRSGLALTHRLPGQTRPPTGEHRHYFAQSRR
jgi:hypothetical protein